MSQSTPAAPILELRGIGHTFTDGRAKRAVLKDIDLRLEPGEFVAITGPSGAGKTTLLRIAAGLLAPNAGTVKFRGTDVYAQGERFRARLRRRELGFVFQEHNLLEVLSAVENVSLPLELDGMPSKRAAALAHTALNRVGLGEQAHAFPEQMSGGERQRVAIARAIVGDKSLVLADEPTGALDSINGAHVVSTLAE
ncbi:MAG: ABC transporter ATP-binding protein, partial [Dactylosporangium sp.]|nr:ABC transporter ATP-binding protein [Dactylosporangium sp.]